MTHAQSHEEALAAMRAAIDADLGPDPRELQKLHEIKTKPAMTRGYSLNPAAKGLKPIAVSLVERIRELATAPNRHERRAGRKRAGIRDRNARSNVARLLEAYNRQSRAKGGSGRTDQGALKASGVDVGKELLFGFLNLKTGQLDPEDATIAAETGWSRRTVQRARERLRLSGLLGWFRRSKWTSSGWKPTSNLYFWGSNGQRGAESPLSKVIRWGERPASPPCPTLLGLASSLSVVLHVDAT